MSNENIFYEGSLAALKQVCFKISSEPYRCFTSLLKVNNLEICLSVIVALQIERVVGKIEQRHRNTYDSNKVLSDSFLIANNMSEYLSYSIKLSDISCNYKFSLISRKFQVDQ